MALVLDWSDSASSGPVNGSGGSCVSDLLWGVVNNQVVLLETENSLEFSGSPVGELVVASSPGVGLVAVD